MILRTIFVILVILPQILFAQKEKQPVAINRDRIQNVLEKSIDNQRIFGAVLSISKGENTQHFAAGNLNLGDTYFIASVSKLYTSALLFQMIEQGQLDWDDPINKYLDSKTLERLHIYKGKDYSQTITIRQLVTQTSGLSDYFAQGTRKHPSIFDRLITYGDTSLSFDQMMETTKGLPAQFAPGTKGKAFYSDSNFQLLGKILQNKTGKTMADLYQENIVRPLNLKQTYLYNIPTDTFPSPFYYKDKILDIPLMMSSFQSDGGLVANSEECLTFLKAHLNGILFSNNTVALTTNWNKIYPPFRYGYGIMKFKFFGVPEMIGHAGANGSFAYYIPSKDVYLAGTINQVDKPQQVYTFLAKILNAIE